MIKIANGAYTYGTQTGFHDVNINVNRGMRSVSWVQTGLESRHY